MKQEKSQRVNTMKWVKGQPMCTKTKANPYSHQMKVILVKKNLLFGVISLLLKGGKYLGQLVTTVTQPMLVTLSVMALQT